MTYSTVTQLRENLPTYSSGVISDSEVTNRIALADKKVYLWLTGLGIQADINDYPDTPYIVNLYSQALTCELVLAQSYTNYQGEEPLNLKFWREFREKIESDVANGLSINSSGVTLYADIPSYSNDLPDDIYFGYGYYGQVDDALNDWEQ